MVNLNWSLFGHTEPFKSQQEITLAALILKSCVRICLPVLSGQNRSRPANWERLTGRKSTSRNSLLDGKQRVATKAKVLVANRQILLKKTYQQNMSVNDTFPYAACWHLLWQHELNRLALNMQYRYGCISLTNCSLTKSLFRICSIYWLSWFCYSVRSFLLSEYMVSQMSWVWNSNPLPFSSCEAGKTEELHQSAMCKMRKQWDSRRTWKKFDLLGFHEK